MDHRARGASRDYPRESRPVSRQCHDEQAASAIKCAGGTVRLPSMRTDEQSCSNSSSGGQRNGENRQWHHGGSASVATIASRPLPMPPNADPASGPAKIRKKVPSANIHTSAMMLPAKVQQGVETKDRDQQPCRHRRGKHDVRRCGKIQGGRREEIASCFLKQFGQVGAGLEETRAAAIGWRPRLTLRIRPTTRRGQRQQQGKPYEHLQRCEAVPACLSCHPAFDDRTVGGATPSIPRRFDPAHNSNRTRLRQHS